MGATAGSPTLPWPGLHLPSSVPTQPVAPYTTQSQLSLHHHICPHLRPLLLFMCVCAHQVSPSITLHLVVLRQGSSLNAELTDSPNPAGQWTSGIFPLPNPSVTEASCHTRLVHGYWGSKLKSSCLHSSCLTDSHLPSPSVPHFRLLTHPPPATHSTPNHRLPTVQPNSPHFFLILSHLPASAACLPPYLSLYR